MFGSMFLDRKRVNRHDLRSMKRYSLRHEVRYYIAVEFSSSARILGPHVGLISRMVFMVLYMDGIYGHTSYA